MVSASRSETKRRGGMTARCPHTPEITFGPGRQRMRPRLLVQPCPEAVVLNRAREGSRRALEGREDGDAAFLHPQACRMDDVLHVLRLQHRGERLRRCVPMRGQRVEQSVKTARV